MADLDDFGEEYGDRVDDIMRASHNGFSRALNDWLDLLESSPISKPVIAQLSSAYDSDTWLETAFRTQRGMVGSGRLDWSKDRAERLSQNLSILRFMAGEANAFGNFAMAFSWAGNNLNANISKINDEIITPFARDLLKHIQRASASHSSAPASDRVVPLDHNSADVVSLSERLAEIEKEMIHSNSLKSAPGYDRNLAEVAAARRLIEAPEVRPSALEALLGPAMRWIALGTASALLSVAVAAVASLVAGLFGFTILGPG